MQDPPGPSPLRSIGPRHNHIPVDGPLGSPPGQAVKCPRCDSLNTKFCYYNNYNVSQPRHFCKNCGRYWTKGGALRNIPVGGCRKTTRSKAKKLTEDCFQKGSPSTGNTTSRSCSESSSVTASDPSSSSSADISIHPNPATAPLSPPPNPPSSVSHMDQIVTFPESTLFQNRNPSVTEPSGMMDIPPKGIGSKGNSGKLPPSSVGGGGSAVQLPGLPLEIPPPEDDAHGRDFTVPR